LCTHAAPPNPKFPLILCVLDYKAGERVLEPCVNNEPADIGDQPTHPLTRSDGKVILQKPRLKRLDPAQLPALCIKPHTQT